MTTYNTGNPIGSTDPRDLYDNAENLDEAVNSDGDTFQDRLGKSRLTWSGIVKSGTGDAGVIVPVVQQAVQDVIAGVDGQVAVAEGAADRAEAAADVAMAAGWVYSNVAAGEAARVDGDYFWVVSADDTEVLELWLMGASSATDTGKRVVNADTVLKPSYLGKKNLWKDVFFRYASLDNDYFGAKRFKNPEELQIEENPHFPIGNSISKTLGGNPSITAGPLIFYGENDISEGDTITVSALLTSTGRANLLAIEERGHGQSVGVQLSAGAIIASATQPTLFQIEYQVLAGATRLCIYPYSDDGFQIKIHALWITKGTKLEAPKYPLIEDLFVNSFYQESINADVDAKLPPLIAANNYAFIVSEEVFSDAESIEIQATNTQPNAGYGSPFSGAGVILSPASVSFNAVRANFISRPTNTLDENKWDYIKCVIRTGAEPSVAASTVIAVGEIRVPKNQQTLENVTIILRDPDTGEVKTITDSDIDTYYMIGFYAEKSDGSKAVMGIPRGSLSNDVGGSYYTTQGDDPIVGGWARDTNNPKVGFTHLLLTNPEIQEVVSPSAALVQDIDKEGYIPPTPLYWEPPKIYAVQDFETSVYFGNLIADGYENYYWDVSGSSIGRQQNERWLQESSTVTANQNATISVFDKVSAEKIFDIPLSLQVGSTNAGNGTTKNILVIGDSLTNEGVITNTLLNNASTDVMSINLVGTRGTAPNLHEGRGGWGVDDYATEGRTDWEFTVSGVTIEPAINSTEYTNNGATFRVQEVNLTGGSGTIVCSLVSGTGPISSGSLTKSNAGDGDSIISFSANQQVSQNPFWINGQLDFQAYLTNNGFATPDIVFIMLGVNDVFGHTTDTSAKSGATEKFNRLDSLIANIHLVAGVDVAIIPVAGPSSDQDAFGQNYANGQTQWRVKRNNIIWNKTLITKYAGQEANGIWICPAGLNWDTKNNVIFAEEAPINSRSSILVKRQNNGVHPSSEGYRQIGDAIWAFIKCHA